MLPQSSKRAASTSPVRDSKHVTKRLRFAKDVWSEEEHRQQDEAIKKRLVGRDGNVRQYNVNDEMTMAFILKHVVQVASEANHSHLFPASATTDDYNVALENDPDLLRVVGECYKSGSYKSVRCLGEPFCILLAKPPY